MTGAAPGQPRQPRQRRGQPQAGAARRGGAGDRGGQEQDAAGRRAQGGAAAGKGEDSAQCLMTQTSRNLSNFYFASLMPFFRLITPFLYFYR